MPDTEKPLVPTVKLFTGRPQDALLAHGNHDQSTHGNRHKASAMIDSVRESGGGATISLAGKRVTTGFAVGGLGPSVAATAAEFFSGPKGQEKGRELYRAFLRKNKTALSLPDATIGFYHDADDGMIFIDVAQNIPDGRGNRALAKRIGRERNERSIYHLTKSELILTGGTGGV